MAKVDRQGFKLVFAVVRTPTGKVLAQPFQIAWNSVRVVEQLLQLLTIDSQLLGDEGVVGVRPGGFLRRPLEVLFLLKVHELADAERAVGERPVHSIQTASINSRNVRPS